MKSDNKVSEYELVLRNALEDIENLSARLAHYSEPIAVIGMSCRFPGGANSVEEYWRLLVSGRDGISEIPPSRWNADLYYDPDPEAPGKMITKLGGFLNIDVSEFDATFFGISPKEAEYLDPQQRLLLEVSCEALQSTGLNIASLEGSAAGIFVGICSHDYIDLLTATGEKNLINPYLATGNVASTATGRISFFYGFHGPNFALDTACSSSLVAIDEACKNLRHGDANLALAGGVNLILSPDPSINFSKAGMLASDGHCKTFDARADGYVRGEGCGMVVLKRLSDAKRDGNSILGIIKSSAINQDGASSGLTVPNGEAQEKLIRKVLKQADLKASDIDYVEAHGTGTTLGDPIEVRAIGATYGERGSENPIKLGSVKTNIGHLEGAAGIASVIKVILALQHETLPKNLHFSQLNPHIDLNFPAEILRENRDWKRGEKIRRAAVSSFGFSGTNAHLIIEEGPELSAEQKKQLLMKPDFHKKHYWVEAIEKYKNGLEEKNRHSWFYQVEWIIQKNKAEQKKSLDKREFLIFGKKKDFEKFFSSLREQCSFVQAGDVFSQNENFYSLDYKNPDHFDQLFRTAKTNKEITDLVFFAHFDSSCEALLHLIQALLRTDLKPKLWILSCQAHSIREGEMAKHPEQSALLGFGKVIALEHPELRCVRLDYEDLIHPEKLLEEFEIEGKEDEIALRNDLRFVPRLKHYLPQAEKHLIISEQNYYLITGGLGGLGQLCLEWLIEKGAKNFILTGRSKPKASLEKRLDQYRRKGIQIQIILGDISKKSDVEQLFQTLLQNQWKLKGIIHAAGVAIPGFISQQNWQEFCENLGPKIQGTNNLAQALLATKTELDFFVLFSSVSGALGSISTAGYAAGNYYMEEYAKLARNWGLPAISISWGPWRSIGMVSSEEERELRLGYKLISPKEGMKALEMALKDNSVSSVIVPIDWEKYFINLSFIANIYSSILGEQQKFGKITFDVLGSLLQNANPEHRPGIATEYIRSLLKKVLGMKMDEALDETKGFFEMGMDSLMAMTLRNELQIALGERCSLKSTTTFDYPHLASLTNYVLTELGYRETPLVNEQIKAEIEERKIEEDIKKLSDDEVLEKLKRELQDE